MTDRWDRSYARAQAAFDAMEAPCHDGCRDMEHEPDCAWCGSSLPGLLSDSDGSVYRCAACGGLSTLYLEENGEWDISAYEDAEET